MDTVTDTQHGLFDGYHEAWNDLLDAQNTVIAAFLHEHPESAFLATAARGVLESFHAFRNEQFNVYTTLMLRIQENEYRVSRLVADGVRLCKEADNMKQELYRLRMSCNLSEKENGSS